MFGHRGLAAAKADRHQRDPDDDRGAPRQGEVAISRGPAPAHRRCQGEQDDPDDHHLDADDQSEAHSLGPPNRISDAEDATGGRSDEHRDPARGRVDPWQAAPAHGEGQAKRGADQEDHGDDERRVDCRRRSTLAHARGIEGEGVPRPRQLAPALGPDDDTGIPATPGRQQAPAGFVGPRRRSRPELDPRRAVRVEALEHEFDGDLLGHRGGGHDEAGRPRPARRQFERRRRHAGDHARRDGRDRDRLAAAPAASHSRGRPWRR